MASRLESMRKIPLLPSGAGEFLRRRTLEAIGIAFALSGLLLLAALASYVSSDPSLNAAGDGPVANLLGPGGAVVADLALQLFGLAAIVPAAAAMFWGFRLWTRHRLPKVWWRVWAVIVALLMVPPAVTLLVPDKAWPVFSGAGGWVGAFLSAHMITLAEWSDAGRWPVAAVAFLVALAAVMAALGLDRSDCRAVTRGIWRLGRRTRQLWTGAHDSQTAAGPGDLDEPVGRGAASLRAATTPAARKMSAKRSPTVVGAKSASAGKREAAERQSRLLLDDNDIRRPPLHLLAVPKSFSGATARDDAALEQNARMLETVLQDFGVQGKILRVREGPVVTRYELEPAPGTRAARVVALADDIARSMSAVSARVSVIPGQNAIGIELPNSEREIVFLRELLGSRDYERAGARLPLVLGKDISGSPVIVDLDRMPHLLVAGTTGSGKSVAVNSMILSLLYRLTPEHCRMILIDPKMLELSVYDDIPHLLHPVVVDPHKAVTALKWAVKEMNARYRLMSTLNVRNIAGYNRRLAEARAKGEVLERTVQTGFDQETGQPIYETQPLATSTLPHIVVVVDEMADLMLVAGKDIEVAIQSLAQKARAAGIHLIIATQRPSVDVITGTIKANLPTRISFQVTSKIDSRTILGEQGAEQLLGMGDMLYMAGGGQVKRIHGPFVSDQEVEDVATFLRAQGVPDYLDAVTDDGDDELLGGMDPSERGGGNELFDKAVALVARERKASTSFIQRHLSIGYNRAAKIIERMETEGMVGRANHVGKREVLLPEPGGGV